MPRRERRADVVERVRIGVSLLVIYPVTTRFRHEQGKLVNDRVTAREDPVTAMI